VEVSEAVELPPQAAAEAVEEPHPLPETAQQTTAVEMREIIQVTVVRM
jgi:hypothetical protein